MFKQEHQNFTIVLILSSFLEAKFCNGVPAFITFFTVFWKINILTYRCEVGVTETRTHSVYKHNQLPSFWVWVHPPPPVMDFFSLEIVLAQVYIILCFVKNLNMMLILGGRVQ